MQGVTIRGAWALSSSKVWVAPNWSMSSSSQLTPLDSIPQLHSCLHYQKHTEPSACITDSALLHALDTQMTPLLTSWAAKSGPATVSCHKSPLGAACSISSSSLSSLSPTPLSTCLIYYPLINCLHHHCHIIFSSHQASSSPTGSILIPFSNLDTTCPPPLAPTA